MQDQGGTALSQGFRFDRLCHTGQRSGFCPTLLGDAMEETLENQKGEDFRIFHPSFYQCLSVFLIPLPMFLFLFYGVRLFYVLSLFWLLETSFLIFVWVFLATTFYVLLPDRIEIRTG